MTMKLVWKKYYKIALVATNLEEKHTMLGLTIDQLNNPQSAYWNVCWFYFFIFLSLHSFLGISGCHPYFIEKVFQSFKLFSIMVLPFSTCSSFFTSIIIIYKRIKFQNAQLLFVKIMMKQSSFCSLSNYIYICGFDWISSFSSPSLEKDLGSWDLILNKNGCKYLVV